MKNLKISARLLMIVTAAILGMLVLMAFSLYAKKSELTESRQVKTQHIIEAVHSLVGHFGKLETTGVLSRKAAQNAAKQAIKDLRYDEKEYVWINDYDAVIVMHPIKPQLDGKNLAEFKDPAGKKLFTEFANTVKKASLLIL